MFDSAVLDVHTNSVVTINVRFVEFNTDSLFGLTKVSPEALLCLEPSLASTAFRHVLQLQRFS